MLICSLWLQNCQGDIKLWLSISSLNVGWRSFAAIQSNTLITVPWIKEMDLVIGWWAKGFNPLAIYSVFIPLSIRISRRWKITWVLSISKTAGQQHYHIWRFLVHSDSFFRRTKTRKKKQTFSLFMLKSYSRLISLELNLDCYLLKINIYYLLYDQAILLMFTNNRPGLVIKPVCFKACYLEFKFSLFFFVTSPQICCTNGFWEF